MLKRIGLLLLGTVCSGAFAFHFFSFGYEQCHPRRTPVTGAEEARARTTLPGLVQASFSARDDVTIRGWFVPARNGVVVVLVHGLWGNRASLLPEAELLARHGYGVLLFDSRAHGTSGGDAATWGSTEASDVGSAVAFVRGEGRAERVALLGFSVGASAVSRAAANDPRVAAVVLYATWPSLREEIAYKVKGGGWLGAQFALLGFRYSGARIDEIHPERDLPGIAPRPILFVSGGQDTDTPPSVMDRMYAAASSPKELWREPSAGHGGYFQADPQEYERRVIGFLDRSTAAAVSR